MKILFQNRFHNLDAIISIKDDYAPTKNCGDIMSNLDYEVYDRGNDLKYAKRKLKEIKDKTCGVKECCCGGFNKLTILSKINH